jgi:hypothetical protein
VNVAEAVAVLALVATFGLVFSRLSRKYKRMFSDAHILEIWTKMLGTKTAALEGLTQPASASASLSGWLTDAMYTTAADIAFMYTIDQQQDLYVHHISMSYRRGVLAWGAARFMIALLGEILSVDVRTARIWRGTGTIYHVEFDLDGPQEGQFVTRSIVVPDSAMLPEIRRRLQEFRLELTPTAPPALG